MKVQTAVRRPPIETFKAHLDLRLELMARYFGSGRTLGRENRSLGLVPGQHGWSSKQALPNTHFECFTATINGLSAAPRSAATTSALSQLSFGCDIYALLIVKSMLGSQLACASVWWLVKPFSRRAATYAIRGIEPSRVYRRLLSSSFKLRFCLISRLVRISPLLRLA